MAKYSLNPIGFAEWGSYRMLIVIKGTTDLGTQPADRKQAIDALISLHGIDLKTTQSLDYDPALRQPGFNEYGKVRIGPSAFAQDYHWLAAIVFHEVIHSDQFDFYSSNGLDLSTLPRTAQPGIERTMMKALDEYEAYLWVSRNSSALGLTDGQKSDIKSRLFHAKVDIYDEKTAAFASKGEFDAARLDLIKRYGKTGTASSSWRCARPNASCCQY